MEYPDSPLRDVLAYDHLRPYLFTQHLRFSFGSMKGRPREEWQHDVAKLSLPDSIAEIKGRGFSALYVNRKAYPNHAADLEESLRALGYDRKIDNQLDDTFCVLLR
jgi:phosphoglycerol transferase